MSNSIQDFELNQISSIDLGSADIGGNINDRLGTINENFNKIVQNDYLKGSQGDSINVVSVDINHPSDLGGIVCYLMSTNGPVALYKSELYIRLVRLITTIGDPDPVYWLRRIKLSISLLCKRDEQGQDILVSSLPITFIDELYLRSMGELDPNMPCQYDLSCVIYFSETDNTFKKSYSFPQIYKGTNGEFYWKINGRETQITVRGLQGPKGDPGSPIYFTKYEILVESGNQIYKLKQVYIPGERWLEFDNLPDGYKQILTSGTPTISINVGNNVNNPPLVFGTINASTVSNTTVYSIVDSVDLGITLEMLLTNNTQGCLYLPSLKTPSDHHVMKSEMDSQNNGVFKMDVLEYNSTDSEWGEETKASDYKFINNYGTVEYTGNVTHSGNVTITGAGKQLKSENGARIIADQLSAAPSISFTDDDEIQIQVGGKTSTPATIPFATNATDATRSEFAYKLGPTNNNAKSYLQYLALKPRFVIPISTGETYNVEINGGTYTIPIYQVQNVYNGEMIYMTLPTNWNDAYNKNKIRIMLQSHSDANWWIGGQNAPSVYQCYINAPASVKIDQFEFIYNGELSQNFYRPASDSLDFESALDTSRREIILTGYRYPTGIDWYISHILYNKVITPVS